MGYYNNLEVANAADPDRFMAWFRAHEKALPANELNRLILGEQTELWQRIEAWESMPTPLRARQHVALQTSAGPTRKQLIALEKARNADRVELERFAYIAIVLLLIVTGLIVWMVA